MLLIGSGNRGPGPLLNLRPLHRNVIFAIENHFSLVMCPPLFLVASSTSDATAICDAHNVNNHSATVCVKDT